MTRKHLLQPERLRRIPPSFSWVDHRLVRDHYLPRADHSAWALYLFLLTVADVQGLSFYSDRAIAQQHAAPIDHTTGNSGEIGSKRSFA